MNKLIILILCSILAKIDYVNAKLVHQEPPAKFNPKIEVSACFLIKDDKVLFLKRSPTTVHGETWGIPGGKQEKGETPEATMIREIREETHIELDGKPIKSYGKVFIRYPKIDFVYHMFECQFEELPEVAISSEHTEYRWITLEEALQLPLIPGEDECIELCYGGILR